LTGARKDIGRQCEAGGGNRFRKKKKGPTRTVSDGSRRGGRFRRSKEGRSERGRTLCASVSGSGGGKLYFVWSEVIGLGRRGVKGHLGKYGGSGNHTCETKGRQRGASRQDFRGEPDLGRKNRLQKGEERNRDPCPIAQACGPGGKKAEFLPPRRREQLSHDHRRE